MLLNHRPPVLIALATCVLTGLSACANTPWGDTVERSLAIDPALEGEKQRSSTPQNQEPRQTESQTGPVTGNSEAANGDDFIGPQLPQEDSSRSRPARDDRTPRDSERSGRPESLQTAKRFSDLDQAPPELRQYLEAVAALDVLTSPAIGNNGNLFTEVPFEPNQPVSRRAFARWLVTANNRIYADRPARQIRLALESSKPVFQDVPTTDPDFPAIQGLAAAGIIPSPLADEGVDALFRPDANLSREDLILWKVPLDIRETLPTADVKAIQQHWGFQDAAKIRPKAQRAVLMDYQNGELANISRAFGYTTLFQPQKAVTRAEAAATLWYFGFQEEGLSAEDALQLQASTADESIPRSSRSNQPSRSTDSESDPESQ